MQKLLEPLDFDGTPLAFHGVSYQNLSAHSAAETTTQTGHIVQLLNRIQGHVIGEAATSTFLPAEVPQMQRIVEPEPLPEPHTDIDGQLYDGIRQLIGNGQFQSCNSQRFRSDNHHPTPSCTNKTIDIIHKTIMLYAQAENDALSQGFLYIDRPHDIDDVKWKAVKECLARNDYTIDGQEGDEERLLHCSAIDTPLQIHGNFRRLKLAFEEEEEMDGNDHTYHMVVKSPTGTTPLGTLLAPAAPPAQPNRRVIPDEIVEHWAVGNLLRQGGFREKPTNQQKILSSGSYGTQTKLSRKGESPAFNGLTATVQALEAYGLDLSNTQAGTGLGTVLARLRTQIMTAGGTNDLLLLHTVTDMMTAINPQDTVELRVASAAYGKDGAPYEYNETPEGEHLRAIHYQKSVDEDLAFNTVKEVAFMFGLTNPEGDSVLSADAKVVQDGDKLRVSGALIPPEVNTGKDASVLLSTAIVVTEQAVIEQLLTRALAGDQESIAALDAIGDAISNDQFTGTLMDMGHRIVDENHVSPYGLGRQHAFCEPLKEYVREQLGLLPAITEMQALMEHGAEPIQPGYIEGETSLSGQSPEAIRNALANIWRVSDALEGVSAMVEGTNRHGGLQAGLEPLTTALAPELSAELSHASKILARQRSRGKVV